MADNFTLPDGYTDRLFQIESGGNPNASNGSYRGLGQFGPREEATYGINDNNRADPVVQATAVANEAARNRSRLATVLGRDPSGAEFYLAHQQGLAGASALLGDPDQAAWQAIRRYYGSDDAAKRAIAGNIPGDHPLKKSPIEGVTSGAFTGMWRDKFDGTKAAPAAVASVDPMSLAPPAAVPGVFSPPSAAGASAQSMASQFLTAAQQQKPVGLPLPVTPGLLSTAPLHPLPLRRA